MGAPGGPKTGGRIKGVSRNKSTIAREAAMAEAAKMLLSSDSGEKFDGDAATLLRAVYQNPAFPIQLRTDCAKAALRTEVPELEDVPRYVAVMPMPVKDLDEWRRLYMDAKPDASPEDVAWHEKLAQQILDDDKKSSPFAPFNKPTNQGDI
jgi:hypothetical protein